MEETSANPVWPSPSPEPVAGLRKDVSDAIQSGNGLRAFSQLGHGRTHGPNVTGTAEWEPLESEEWRTLRAENPGRTGILAYRNTGIPTYRHTSITAHELMDNRRIPIWGITDTQDQGRRA